MTCPNCKKEDPQNREMCPECGYPVKPIPIPPGGKIRFGEYDWFVLDEQNDRMLIITEKVIGKRAYHSQECEITWETCDMRKYLNGEFYCSFGESDRERIMEATNENPDNPWYGTNGGNPTNDKIFLLSIGEVLKYFGDSGQITTRYMYPNCEWCKDEFLPWLDDQYNINRRAVDDTGIVRHWELRSPGSNGRCVASVSGFCGDGFDQGAIFISGNCELVDGHFMLDASGGLTEPKGIRPALWLKRKMKKLSLDNFMRLRKLVHRGARPLDFTMWKYLFENGSCEDLGAHNITSNLYILRKFGRLDFQIPLVN